MSHNNAATRPVGASILARTNFGWAIGTPANDSSLAQPEDGIGAVTTAALLHFAEHGLGAARDARAQAELAFAAKDELAFEHWRSVCHTLDKEAGIRLDRSTIG